MLKITPAAAIKPRVEDFPKPFIDSVVAATDIEKIVGQAVELKRSGHNLFGLCPFHGEKSPSFSVAPAKQMYHCFGCGSSGDAIKFLREYAALSFREAVTELAELARIPLPSVDPSQPAVPAPDLSSLVKANEISAAFFRHCLRHTEVAKEYVRKRRITAEAAKRFIIGFAPEGWQSLQEPFKDYNTSKALVGLGLVIEKEGRRYDRFRERLMFGIRDARGRIVGWGGRSIDGTEPKYLNSPASVLFDKSSQLFGIYEAREAIRATKQVIVTEGYIDTVANSMAGLQQTVATMGTACTEHHLERLCALAPEVIFSFDGDKAGLAAAKKSLNTCLPFATDERTFRFLILPPGMDPDEVIAAQGVEAYKEMLGKAMPMSTFLITHLVKDIGGLDSAEQRARFIAEANALIERLPQGGNLRKILRSEVMKASAFSKDELATLATSPKDIVVADRVPKGPWQTITLAALAQPATAAEKAPEILELVSKELQDAFFNSNVSAFPEHQQMFWRALDAAILAEDPKDTETPIAMAQRDLLNQGVAVVSTLLRKDSTLEKKRAFRNGQTTEDEFLSDVASRSRFQDRETS
jgi:DNA primase